MSKSRVVTVGVKQNLSRGNIDFDMLILLIHVIYEQALLVHRVKKVVKKVVNIDF